MINRSSSSEEESEEEKVDADILNKSILSNLSKDKIIVIKLNDLNKLDPTNLGLVLNENETDNSKRKSQSDSVKSSNKQVTSIVGPSILKKKFLNVNENSRKSETKRESESNVQISKNENILTDDEFKIRELISTETNALNEKNSEIISVDNKSIVNEICENRIDLEFANKSEFDELIFASDVATPALEEPEFFNINGSSTSLMTTGVTNRNDLQTSKQRSNSTNENSSQSNDAASCTSTNTSKSKEYKLIHSMFANKSRVDSKKS